MPAHVSPRTFPDRAPSATPAPPAIRDPEPAPAIVEPPGVAPPAAPTATAGVGGQFAALGAGEVVARLAAFALTIVLARRLGPAAYGIVGVVMGVMLYLTQVADAGVELVGVPLVARAGRDIGAIASPVLTYRVAFALVLTALVVPIGLLLLPQPDGTLLAIAALALPCTAFGTRWILLGLDRAGAIALARVAGELSALGLVLVFVREASDLARVPMAQVAGVALTTLLMLVAVVRSGVALAPRRDWNVAGPVFERSRHLLLFTLLGLLLFNLDLIVLRMVSGAEQAGWYAAAYTLIAFCANLFVAFSQAALPALARVRDDPVHRSAAYQRLAAQALAVAVPVAVGGTIIAPDLLSLVFGERFAPAVPALRVLLWSVPAAALREVATAGLIAAQRERALLGVNASSVVANVLLIAVLIPTLGLTGAAIATLLTELARLGIVLSRAHASGLPSRPAHAGRPLLAGAVMGAVLVAAGIDAPIVAVPVGAAVYLLVLTALGALRFSGLRWPEFRP